MIEEKEYTRCLRCGRVLKSPEYRKIGYGKVCLEKMQNNSKKLFEQTNKRDK